MGTIIISVIVLFILASLIAFVSNKNKEKKFEQSITDAVAKTKKIYYGSLNRYIDYDQNKTILRYFPSGKMNTLADFIPTDEILANHSLVLFDDQRKKIAILPDIRKHGITTTMLYSDIISLQPVEVSKNKKVTRGGISPIAVAGYRWASSTTKMLKQIEHIYVDIRYKAYGKESSSTITFFDGISYEDRAAYEKIVAQVSQFINDFHDIVVKE